MSHTLRGANYSWTNTVDKGSVLIYSKDLNAGDLKSINWKNTTDVPLAKLIDIFINKNVKIYKVSSEKIEYIGILNEILKNSPSHRLEYYVDSFLISNPQYLLAFYYY